MLPHFFRHYDPLVDRYFIFDDGSTDRTLEILSGHPKVIVRRLPRAMGDSYIVAARGLHNTCWKDSRGSAAWVIYTAVDEFLYTDDPLAYLHECAARGITAIPALGYQMISTNLPNGNESLIQQVRTGCPWDKMNKLSIFNPHEISETNFHAGRHFAEPEGNVVYPNEDVLLNLHFKYLNFARTFERHQELEKKLGSLDRKNGWGHKYSWPESKFKEDWDYFEKNAHPDIFGADYSPKSAHSSISERWWRKH